MCYTQNDSVFLHLSEKTILSILKVAAFFRSAHIHVGICEYFSNLIDAFGYRSFSIMSQEKPSQCDVVVLDYHC